MGIKGWLTVGGVVLTGVAVWLGLKKKGDEHYEKIQKIIRDVDWKEQETAKELPKTVEEITEDINDAIAGMDIDSDEMTQVTDEKVDEILKKGNEVLQKANDMLGDSEANRKAEAELAAKIDEINSDLIEKQEKLKKEAEEKAEAQWKRKVKKAVEQKNYRVLEDLFDEKYNPYPYHPSPATVFGEAVHHGVISEDFYHMAAEYFGKLWCYSGD